MGCYPVLISLLLAAAPVDLKAPLEALRGVGPDGKGSAEAARAWREVVRAEPAQLPQVLAAMDGANAVARNWIRSAADRILENAKGQPLPAAALEKFLLDTKHDPQARRLAYELLVKNDKEAPERYLPRMLDDPSRDLRHDAVARLVEKADADLAAGHKPEALTEYRRAFASARDKPQLDRLARVLREQGEKVDLPAHLGLITTWKVIGPFPNDSQKGVTTVYPPEKEFNAAAEYDGKAGRVHWKDWTTKGDYAIVELKEALGNHSEAVAYAFTEVTSGKAHDAEVRLGCYTSFKLFVNGQLVLERGDALTGMELDHYVAPVHLKEGRNTILLKVWQDQPPPAPVPQDWKFMLRVCDGGGAVLPDVQVKATK